MKKYFSMLAIIARSTIYKITGIFLLMIVTETAFFYMTLQKILPTAPLLLEEIIDQSQIFYIYAAAFFALCAVLCLFGSDRFGSQSKYTIRRLFVSEKVTVSIWSAYNIFCFVMLWAVQLVIALILCQMYINYIDPSFYGSHTVFLAFYCSEFLHSLLPLDELSIYIRNFALILGLGFSCACFSLKHRRGQKSFAAVVLAVITVVFFQQRIGNFGLDVFVSIIALITAISSIYYIWWGGENE